MFENSDRCGQTVAVATAHILAKVKCLIREDLRIAENEIKDRFDLSSGSLNRILCHHLYGSAAPDRRLTSLPRNRRGVGWSGAFTCFENLTEAGQSGPGTSSRVTRLLYTNMTWKPHSSLQSGFSQVRAHMWIPEIEKHLQTDNCIFFAKSGHATSAPGEEDSQRRVVHQHLPAQGLRGLEHAVQTTAPAACCSNTTTKEPTPLTPLRTTWKQTVFSWSPRPRIPKA